MFSEVDDERFQYYASELEASISACVEKREAEGSEKEEATLKEDVTSGAAKSEAKSVEEEGEGGDDEREEEESINEIYRTMLREAEENHDSTEFTQMMR